MIDFISNEEDKSIGNASDGSKYTDLKANCTWGNYANTTLSGCEGKYCIIDGNGSMVSDWQENINKTNRNSGYTLLTTGSTEEVKKKNIYDLAGNLWEYVQETASGEYTSYRGGSFYDPYTNCPVSYRSGNTFSFAGTHHGFRPILFIK